MSYPLSIASGTQTLSATATEYVLSGAAIAGPHGYSVDLDCAGLVVGDVLVISVYGKALSGGTERLLDKITLSGPQGIPLVQIGPYSGLVSLKVSVNLAAGTTGSAIPWQIADVAEVLRVNPASFAGNVKTTFGSIFRRIHAMVMGNVLKRLAATPAVVTHRDETDAADLVTLTRTIDGSNNETITPS